MTVTTPGPFDVETVSGQYVSLLAPDPSTIRLSDIAWHLATQNRFLGAARRPISVAEHALLVDWALACEAYHLLPSSGRGWGVHGLYVNERDRETPGVRRLALQSPTTHHAVSVEWRSTHNRWMRLHDATLTPTPKEPTR